MSVVLGLLSAGGLPTTVVYYVLYLRSITLHVSYLSIWFWTCMWSWCMYGFTLVFIVVRNGVPAIPCLSQSIIFACSVHGSVHPQASCKLLHRVCTATVRQLILIPPNRVPYKMTLTSSPPTIHHHWRDRSCSILFLSSLHMFTTLAEASRIF